MRYLVGPECCWLILYGAARLMARANVPPVKAIDDLIDKSWFYIPFLALAVFALWWIPVTEKRWLLLRVWVAGILGGHFVLETLMRAYSTQGPGTGMGYLAGMIFLLIALLAGSIFVKIRLG